LVERLRSGIDVLVTNPPAYRYPKRTHVFLMAVYKNRIMEIFIDGGLFELGIAVLFGYAINFIFRRKVLLLAFSGIVVLAPVACLFLQKGEIFYILSVINIMTSLLLVVLLWKYRADSADGKNLFDVKKYWHIVSHKFQRRQTGKQVSENPAQPGHVTSLGTDQSIPL
jgi:hypothetical protein